MKSILFSIDTIWHKQFRFNYLKKKKLFLNLFLQIWNLKQILNISKKRVTLLVDVFLKLRNPKNVVR